MKILDDWRAIKYVARPTYKEQDAAVSQNSEAILFIKSPSWRVCVTAILNRTVSDEVAIKVCKFYSTGITYIDDPTEEVQLAAISTNWRAIYYIMKPSKNVQIAAAHASPNALKLIYEPCLEAILAAK